MYCKILIFDKNWVEIVMTFSHCSRARVKLIRGSTLLFQIIYLLFLSTLVYSQQSIELNGKKLIQIDSVWNIDYLGNLFKVDNSVITVKWKRGIQSSDLDAFLKEQDAVILRSNILGYVDIKIPEKGDFVQKLKKFINSDLVEIAEPNSFGQWGSIPGVPNDQYFSNQWYLNQSNDIDIDAKEAWKYSTGSPSIIVAILDMGFDWRHEDIGRGTDNYENVWLNPYEDVWSNPNDPNTGNHIDDDGNGYVDDWKGWNFHWGNNNSIGSAWHGTYIAGIIGAKTNNNKGISRIAGGWNNPGVKMLSIVVGGFDSISTSLVDDAILYACLNGAKVINMSFQVAETEAINDAIEIAYNYWCTLVACSGNGGPTVWYPARNPNVIAVSGIQQNGEAFRSCWGPEVDISALAGDSTDNHFIFSTRPDNQYGYTMGGTSYAAPQVAGAAALLYSVRPLLTPQQVKCILEKTADDMGTPGYDGTFGWGRVNAYHALQATIIKLISPSNNSTGSLMQTLTWNQLYGATSYRVQVAKNINFINPDFDQSGITTTFFTADDLTPNTDYYWHVKADDDLCNIAAWSETWKFTTSYHETEPPTDPQKTAYHANEEQPISSLLLENYPDPFNPKTKIKYALPHDAIMTLKIFDILGREIATIVNEYQLSGWHEIDFNASYLPAGVYIYKIQAGMLIDIKKMIICK